MRKNQAAFFAFIVGLFFSGVVIYFLLRAEHYQSWPKVEAQIIQKEYYNSRGEGAKVDIEYQYKINNVLYVDEKTLYKNDFNSLISGNRIYVAYNPKNPEDNIVFAVIGYGTYTLISSVLMFFALSIYYLVISEEHYKKLLKRQHDKEEPRT